MYKLLRVTDDIEILQEEIGNGGEVMRYIVMRRDGDSERDVLVSAAPECQPEDLEQLAEVLRRSQG